MAQQLLVARKDDKAQALLRKTASRESSKPRTLPRPGHVERTLGAYAQRLEWALHDADPGVRANALLFSEPFKAGNQFDSVYQDLLGDAHGQVVMQLAYSLGASDSPRAGEFLGKLLAHAPGQIPGAAVFSSVNAKNWPAFLALFSTRICPTYAQANLMRLSRHSEAPKTRSIISPTGSIGSKENPTASNSRHWPTLLDGLKTTAKATRKNSKASKRSSPTARAVVADPKAPASDKVLAIGF